MTNTDNASGQLLARTGSTDSSIVKEHAPQRRESHVDLVRVVDKTYLRQTSAAEG